MLSKGYSKFQMQIEYALTLAEFEHYAKEMEKIAHISRKKAGQVAS